MTARDPITELEELDKRGLRRRLVELEGKQGARLRVAGPDGRELINFSSNDYLGLAADPRLAEAAVKAARDHGFGAGASRLVCGSFAPHHALEDALAAAKGCEAALTFSSGYACGVGVLTALFGRNDTLILDKLCHACLIDGARFSGATVRVFGHNRLDHLASHLRWARETRPAQGRVCVVTESVFSMDGDLADLAAIVEMKDEAGALLLLDEAHATGVTGPGGRGLAAALGLAHRVDFQMGTLSKALGAHGGFVAASRAWIDLLVNKARPMIYSTAPPPPLAAAARSGLEIALGGEGDAQRERLWGNIRAMETVMPGGMRAQSPILPWVVAESDAALAAAAKLRREGFWVPAIRPPTVPPGTARLRFTASAAHDLQDITALGGALRMLAENDQQR